MILKYQFLFKILHYLSLLDKVLQDTERGFYHEILAYSLYQSILAKEVFHILPRDLQVKSTIFLYKSSLTQNPKKDSLSFE